MALIPTIQSVPYVPLPKYVSNYTPLNIGEFVQPVAEAQKRYNTALDTRDLIIEGLRTMINQAGPNEEVAADAIAQSYSQELKNYEENGNWESLDRDMGKIASRFKSDYEQVLKNKTLTDEAITRISQDPNYGSMRESIMEEIKDRAKLGYDSGKFSGGYQPGVYSPEIQLAEYVTKLVDKTAYDEQGNRKYIDPIEIENIARTGMEASPELNLYLEQKIRLRKNALLKEGANRGIVLDQYALDKLDKEVRDEVETEKDVAVDHVVYKFGFDRFDDTKSGPKNGGPTVTPNDVNEAIVPTIFPITTTADTTGPYDAYINDETLYDTKKKELEALDEQIRAAEQPKSYNDQEVDNTYEVEQLKKKREDLSQELTDVEYLNSKFDEAWKLDNNYENFVKESQTYRDKVFGNNQFLRTFTMDPSPLTSGGSADLRTGDIDSYKKKKRKEFFDSQTPPTKTAMVSMMDTKNTEAVKKMILAQVFGGSLGTEVYNVHTWELKNNDKNFATDVLLAGEKGTDKPDPSVYGWMYKNGEIYYVFNPNGTKVKENLAIKAAPGTLEHLVKTEQFNEAGGLLMNQLNSLKLNKSKTTDGKFIDGGNFGFMMDGRASAMARVNKTDSGYELILPGASDDGTVKRYAFTNERAASEIIPIYMDYYAQKLKDFRINFSNEVAKEMVPLTGIGREGLSKFPQAVQFIIDAEGSEFNDPYQDLVRDGSWTWGYGHNFGKSSAGLTTEQMNNMIDKEAANYGSRLDYAKNLLTQDLGGVLKQINDTIPELNSDQITGLSSFCYAVGTKARGEVLDLYSKWKENKSPANYRNLRNFMLSKLGTSKTTPEEKINIKKRRMSEFSLLTSQEYAESE